MPLIKQYLQANRETVLKDAPRRKNDLRVFEANFIFISIWYAGAILYGCRYENVP
jgi:hypothetical protein